MDLDAASAPIVTNFGKQSPAQHEEKEAATASTTVDIVSDGDDNKGGVMPDGMTPTQQLLYAADKGDCDLLRAAINRGADVKVHDMGPKAQAEEKRSIEHEEGKKKTKKQLLAEEKEQETMFRDIPITEDTAMHKAAEKGHVEAVDLLFYAEADIEAKNRLGSTPLHRAVSAKQQEVVAQLLKHGARLDAANAIGNTALHIASYQGDLEMAQLLITHAKHEAYRAVVAVNQAGVTPIDYARKKQMHTLLSSYRLLSSATSSFIRHPLGDHPADGTPKHGRGLIPHVSGNGDIPPQLSRPGSWGKALVVDDGKQTPGGHKDEHGRLVELHSVHHHAPNPPIGGHHNSSHAVDQHGPPVSHQTPSTTSRPLQPNELDSNNSNINYANSNNTIKPTTSPTNSSVAPAALSHASQPLPASTFSTFTGLSNNSTPHLQTPAQPQPSTSEPALLTKPSFEKTSSLDSHPLDSDRRQGSISTVGQIVSPVLATRGAEGSTGSVSVDAGPRGVSMGGLSLNMLPNECEPREEEEKRE